MLFFYIKEALSGSRTFKETTVTDAPNYLSPTENPTSAKDIMVFPHIALLVTSATSVLALGRAIVTNQCDQPVYLWSVGSTISNQTTLPKDSSYSEIFHSDPESGGISIKITSTPDGIFQNGTSQLVFAYSIDGSTVRYNLTSVFGDGFAGRTLRVQPSDEKCDSISWYDGRAPKDGQIKSCERETNLELTFCTGHCLPSWCKCRALTNLRGGILTAS
jgi:hypothetical protein